MYVKKSKKIAAPPDMAKPILFFADKRWPEVGGMETHADQFISYFDNCEDYPLLGVVTKAADGSDLLVRNGRTARLDLGSDDLNRVQIVFHNSGRWIESFGRLRQRFKNAFHVYRTGGNEIAKASLAASMPACHRERQLIWAREINVHINLLITNSSFTESRLKSQGVSCEFLRVVGGVGPTRPRATKLPGGAIRLFCAARFVPYKNHATLIAVMKLLLAAGHRVELRMAGDGPLIEEMKREASPYSTRGEIVFLGKIPNERVMQEIGEADYYLQFSTELRVDVPGGSYLHAEGMGRSILEAIAAGVFVIALDTGALSEIVTPSRGRLLPARARPEQLSDLIGQIIKDGPHAPRPTDDFNWHQVFSSYKRRWQDAF